MLEPFEKELGELLEAARPAPELSEGWRAKAVEGMREARPVIRGQLPNCWRQLFSECYLGGAIRKQSPNCPQEDLTMKGWMRVALALLVLTGARMAVAGDTAREAWRGGKFAGPPSPWR